MAAVSDELVYAQRGTVEALVTAVQDNDGGTIQELFHHANRAGETGALLIALAGALLESRHEAYKALTIIHQTRGIKPAGLSLSQAWEITNRSLDQKAAA